MEELIGLFRDISAEILRNVEKVEDLTTIGSRPGQYYLDLIADEVVLNQLTKNHLNVMSEESGFTDNSSTITVVVDPIDGSTNLSRSLPWYATSFCAVKDDKRIASLIVNLANGDEFYTIGDGPSFRNNRLIQTSENDDLSNAVISFSGFPIDEVKYRQYRSFGAAALEISLVGAGGLEGYVDVSSEGLGIWDYYGALHIASNAGCRYSEVTGLDIDTLIYENRRHPIVASSERLLKDLRESLEKTRRRQAIREVVRIAERRLICSESLKEQKAANMFLSYLPKLDSPFSEFADENHVTASAIVVSSLGFLLHKHLKLGEWMQPGGHIDGFEMPWEAVIRETEEETGLKVKHFRDVPTVINIDVLRGVANHQHFDLRYLLTAEPLLPKPPMNESQEVRWMSYDEAKSLVDESVLSALDSANKYIESVS